jgi:hypothetical protein
VRGRRFACGALALVLVLGAAGCPKKADVRVSFATPDKPPPAKAYYDILKRWTRHGHIISDFDETFAIDASLMAPEVRQAYAEKWIEIYKIGEADAATVRNEARVDHDYYELHAQTTSHTYNVDNLALNKTLWRMALVNDAGLEVTPREVKPTKVRREVETTFFPFADIFTRGWTLRFPKTLPDGRPLIDENTRKLTLRIAGPPGSTDLVWLLK